MRPVARALRYLGIIVADPYGSGQHTARANAAEACARLRERRQEQAEVDAFLLERSATDPPS